MSGVPSLPDWLPGWAIGLIVAVGALYALLLLAMPFSVFGLKGRLDEIEVRLDDLHGDVQAILRRLPAVRGDPIPEDAPQPLAAGPVASPPQRRAGRPLPRQEPRLG